MSYNTFDYSKMKIDEYEKPTYTITLDAGDIQPDGENGAGVGLRALAKAMKPVHFAKLLEDNLNSYDNPHRKGFEIGKRLQRAHFTLQGCIVQFLLGVLAGIQDGVRYTDARNEKAIATARAITEQLDNGDLKYQPFI